MKVWRRFIKHCLNYKYIPIQDVREAMYPKKMTTEELAAALDEIAEDFDPYDYRDHVEPGQDTIQEVMLDLQSGKCWFLYFLSEGCD